MSHDTPEAQPARRVHVFNGPNLNLLGTREPAVYGSATIENLRESCARTATALGLALDFRQTNHEGELVDWVQEAGRLHREGGSVGAVVNAGAYTHTSVALRDALTGSGLRFVEVHISNVHAREPFRHHSYLSDVAAGVIVGLGPAGYGYAIRALADLAQRS